MKEVVEKLRWFMLFSFNIETEKTSSILLIESLKAKKRELIRAKNARTVIGIFCPKLGEGIILSKIEDVLQDVILLRLFDLHGNIIDLIEVSLLDIKGVSPFNTNFAPAVNDKKYSVVYV